MSPPNDEWPLHSNTLLMLSHISTRTIWNVNSKVIYGGSLWKVSYNPIQLRKHSTLTMVQYNSRSNKWFRESLQQSQVELFRGQTSIVSNRLITYKDIVAVSNWGEWKTNFAVCQIENYTPPTRPRFRKSYYTIPLCLELLAASPCDSLQRPPARSLSVSSIYKCPEIVG